MNFGRHSRRLDQLVWRNISEKPCCWPQVESSVTRLRKILAVDCDCLRVGFEPPASHIHIHIQPLSPSLPVPS